MTAESKGSTEAHRPAAPCIGLLEIGHLSPTFVVLDRCLKNADVALVGIENSDSGALCIKVAGRVSAVREAVEVGRQIAKRMHTSVESTILPAPTDEVDDLIRSEPVYNPLLGIYDAYVAQKEQIAVPDALGLLETQGLSSLLHATDEMLKNSNVRVVGKEKIGGGFVTVLIAGDLSAVQTAIQTGRHTVEQLGGKLILADVISNPHPDLVSLLPAK